MTLRGFKIAGGTITGRDHLGRDSILVAKNNQDAYQWKIADNYIIAVVCDGCGSTPHSEVGSKLGAGLLLSCLAKRYRRFAEAQSNPRLPPTPFWDEVRQDVLAKLRVLALQLTDEGEGVTETIRDYFLFTSVGFLLNAAGLSTFSIGDGLIAVNSEAQQLGPFEGNKPPYLAYGMLRTKDFDNKPELLRFKLQHYAGLETLQSVLIGSDGVVDLQAIAEKQIPGDSGTVGPLSQFWEEQRYFRNPDAIRRRLSLFNREVRYLERGSGKLRTDHGLLRDDTTLVVLRKERKEATE